MKSELFLRAFAVAAIVTGFASLALAGPPLICHPIAIGSARSLPWVDLGYHKGNGSYNLNGLNRDTLAILDADNSVLVHMETLRRATIYARQDPQVAKELLVRLHARATNADTGPGGALAWFDVGYLVETYKQWIGSGESNPAKSLDGLAWVDKAIAMRGSDPEMEFGAALITISGPQGEHNVHVQKAIAGAKTDPLLAQNLDSRFNQKTISAVLTEGLKE